jgi:hypothetical protein
VNFVARKLGLVVITTLARSDGLLCWWNSKAPPDGLKGR